MSNTARTRGSGVELARLASGALCSLDRSNAAIWPNLGMPHTRAVSSGLFELQLKSTEGIARVMYCALVGKQIMALHSFVKKSAKTPATDLQLARQRLKEMLNEHDH